MSKTKEMADKLNELLEKNYDSEKGFIKAAEDVKSDKLREFFKEKAKQRYDFGHELKMEIRNLGETPDKGESLKGKIHHMWMDLKSALTSEKEEEILEEVVKGERLAVEDYNKIINNSDFPPSTANLLIKQRNFIERTFNEVKKLEEAYD